MRYLVISDVHANLEALESVLKAAQGAFDRVLCCGDVVGYGANPNEVIDQLAAVQATVIRGNHDKAACGLDDADLFNDSARKAVLWTRGVLSAEHRAFLLNLPQGPRTSANRQFQLVHGSLLDEDEYLYDRGDAYDNLMSTSIPVTFFGHIHLPCLFSLNRRGKLSSQFSLEETLRYSLWISLEPGNRYLINPGSVGQPRDGDPRAAYAIFDSVTGAVMFERAEYDVIGAQEKMRKAKLPEFLIQRLAFGE